MVITITPFAASAPYEAAAAGPLMMSIEAISSIGRSFSALRASCDVLMSDVCELLYRTPSIYIMGSRSMLSVAPLRMLKRMGIPTLPLL